MTEPKPNYSHGGKRKGAGRPKAVKGGYTETCYIRLTKQQKSFLEESMGGCTEGIRRLIDAAIDGGL